MTAAQHKRKSEEKTLRKEVDFGKTATKSLSAETKQELENPNPPRLHRNMRLICDVFRISDQTRYALRSFDAATLDDFSLMTEEDFADMIARYASIGQPLPPLQQRKVSVLLRWARSLPESERVDTVDASPNKAEGFELAERKGGKAGVLTARFKASPRNGDSAYVPADWEAQFYRDLPRLRIALREMGKRRPFSDRATECLSLRWLFCG